MCARAKRGRHVRLSLRSEDDLAGELRERIAGRERLAGRGGVEDDFAARAVAEDRVAPPALAGDDALEQERGTRVGLTESGVRATGVRLSATMVWV